MITAVTWDPKDVGLQALTELAGILALRAEQSTYLSHLVSEGVVVVSDRPLDSATAHQAWEEWVANSDASLRDDLEFTFDTDEFAYDIEAPDIQIAERATIPIEVWQMFTDHTRNLTATYPTSDTVVFTEYLTR